MIGVGFPDFLSLFFFFWMGDSRAHLLAVGMTQRKRLTTLSEAINGELSP